jgi:hypothetical protein
VTLIYKKRQAFIIISHQGHEDGVEVVVRTDHGIHKTSKKKMPDRFRGRTPGRKRRK